MAKTDPLPPATDLDRHRARKAVEDLRRAIADPATMGARSALHLDLSRPRRGQWLHTWSNLPGFVRCHCSKAGLTYTHDLLPGWQYLRSEIKTEMIPDLEALAERGVRPTEATS